MRACRTDKGVHAAGQVVSVKMLVKTDLVGDEGVEDREAAALEATVPLLNATLPSDIRIFGIKRTANSFHSKERCDSRFYEYLLPTYALAPASATPYTNPAPRSSSPTEEAQAGKAPTEERVRAGADSDDEAERLEAASEATPSTGEWVSRLTEEEQCLISEYRLPGERLQQLRDFVARYKGTHPFHNFTIGKSAGDLSSRRHILDVIVGQPFVQGRIEWVSIIFHGQSFMLHQIRKMVGLAIMALRLGCSHALVDRCFEAGKVNIPKAPSLGLLLDKAIFKGYNAKFASTRDALDLDEFSQARQQLKDALIYPKIYEEERSFSRFMGWLKCNDEHGGEFPFLVPFILDRPQPDNSI